MTKVTSLGFIFPGQGSQSIGMLTQLAGEYAVVQQTFDGASEVLGYDLWQLIANGPEQELNQTDRTQPAMLVAGVATWRVWCEQSPLRPAVMAGHSLGEYTALVCAGALEFATAVSLVAQRGRFMQGAVPAGQGAMAAILGLEDDRVRSICDDAANGDIIAAVNFNSPGQVVIAGVTGAVTRAIDLAKAAGAKRALLLPVSVPSHCDLMRPAAESMQSLLEEVRFETPAIPVINNVDVASCESPEMIRDALVRQLYNPVRWVDTIRAMVLAGVDHVIECGPGKVLAGLNKRIERTMTVMPVYDPSTLEKALCALGEKT